MRSLFNLKAAIYFNPMSGDNGPGTSWRLAIRLR
jgi:hypothetical protein